jgi:hypothetical protein
VKGRRCAVQGTSRISEPRKKQAWTESNRATYPRQDVSRYIAHASVTISSRDLLARPQSRLQDPARGPSRDVAESRTGSGREGRTAVEGTSE